MHSVSLGSIECVVLIRMCRITFWFLTTHSIFKRQPSKNEVWNLAASFRFSACFSTFDRMWHCDPIPLCHKQSLKEVGIFHNKASLFIVLVLHLTNPPRKSTESFMPTRSHTKCCSPGVIQNLSLLPFGLVNINDQLIYFLTWPTLLGLSAKCLSLSSTWCREVPFLISPKSLESCFLISWLMVSVLFVQVFVCVCWLFSYLLLFLLFWRQRTEHQQMLNL